MIFASPIWLLLLLPWSALVVWLLSGRLEKREVPFLLLWEDETPQEQKPRRAFRRPPLAVAALLAAMLFAIVAAAGPAISSRQKNGANQPDIEIQSVTVRVGPTTQAMVQLANDSDLKQATLSVRADDKGVYFDQVDLPARGESKNYFVDIPVFANSIRATIDASLQITHSSEVALRGAWPTIETRGPLTAELRRMVDVYTRHRPPSADSRHIAIDQSPNPAEPTAILLDEGTAAETVTSPTSLTIVDDPLTRSMDWPDILTGAKIAGPPGQGWKPLVTLDGIAVLATRESSEKQIWVGFDSDRFPRRPDFVVFWTAVFDDLGGGAPTYEPLAATEPDQSAIALRKPSKSLSGQVLIVALLFLCLSAATWKPTPFTGVEG